MSDYTDREELDFIESLYDESEKYLNEVYKEQKSNQDKLLQEIANVMLVYTILNNFMKLPGVEKGIQYGILSRLITKGTQAQGITQNRVIKNILNSTVNETFDFYSYNSGLKDVKKIVDNNFAGKHFSTRVWDNEEKVAQRLHQQMNNFLNGKINVNQIKKDIEKTFNDNAYYAHRLVETEVSRCSSEAFKRFCSETKVKKIRYNATLDSKLCSDCAPHNEQVFNLGEELEIPIHALCRCYYSIVK